MTNLYEVLDIRPSGSGERRSIRCFSPEAAASQILGLDLVRSGSPSQLTAKVYWHKEEEAAENVVRLYRRVLETRKRER